MSDPDDERVVTSAQRAVDEPIARVLEDRYTDYGDGDGGGGGDGVGKPPPFPSAFMSGADPGLVAVGGGHPLRVALSKLVAAKPFDTMRLALVDLTVDPLKPLYAGYRDTDPTYLASMGKLAALLAAFHLRESARRAAKQITAKSDKDLFSQLNRAWAAEIRKSNRAGQDANNDPPVLNKVLAAERATAKDPFEIDFDKAGDTSFHHQLIMALAFSNNESAAVCIRALGYPYIDGALKAAGLNGKNGFFINADYGNRYWVKSARVLQDGSAQAVAKLLTLIAQDRLAGGGTQQDIFGIIAFGLNGDIGPGISAALTEDDRYSLIVRSKNGYLDNGPFGDSAIIRRKTATGKKLHYIAVVLAANSHAEVQAAAVALDDVVLLANGEKIKPKPPPP